MRYFCVALWHNGRLRATIAAASNLGFSLCGTDSMRKQFLVVVAIATLGWCAHIAAGAEMPAAGKQVSQSTTVKVKGEEGDREVTLRYWLYLPSEYDAKSTEKWPLVLFLHGAGERGDDIEKVKIHGPPKLVSKGKQFPFVLVSPQVPTGGRWNAEELAKLLDSLANTLRIDQQRLYVTGLSMGGSGTWSLVSRIQTNSPPQCRCAAAATWKQWQNSRRRRFGCSSGERSGADGAELSGHGHGTGESRL